MIDAHIHADTRPYEDFGRMVIAGIDTAITCSHDPLRMTTSDVVFDHFQRLLDDDISRAAENGLKLYAALGIHPRGIPRDYERVLKELPSYLKNEDVVAIGELGLESGLKLEEEVLKKQLILAETLKMKAIVHTPRENKEEITKIIIRIIEEFTDPSMVLVDHVDQEIVNYLIDFEGMLGITIQPKKMTPDEAIQLIYEYGSDGFILNSDMSSSPSDPLSVPKMVHKMRLSGFDDKDIRRVSYLNASEFFRI